MVATVCLAWGLDTGFQWLRHCLLPSAGELLTAVAAVPWAGTLRALLPYPALLLARALLKKAVPLGGLVWVNRLCCGLGLAWAAHYAFALHAGGAPVTLDSNTTASAGGAPDRSGGASGWRRPQHRHLAANR